MSETATLELLIQIRDELAGLNRTKQALSEAKKEGEGLGALFRQGLGIGTGMQIAASGIALLKAALIDTTRRAFEFADQIKNGSEELDISTEAFQVLRLELMKAGLDMSRLSMAFTSQSDSMAEARDQASNAATAYRTLGLDLAKLERLPFDQRLIAIARATLTAKDQTEAFQAAGQLLGSRGLPQLLNALRDVANQGYGNLERAALSAGEVMDRDTATRLNNAKETWERYKNWFVVQSAELIDALMNPMSNTPGAILDAMARRQQEDADAATKRANQPKPRDPLEKTDEWRKKQLDLTWEQNKAEQIQQNALTTEAGKREQLIRALERQFEIEAGLADLAEQTTLTPRENMADRLKLIADLNQKLVLLEQQIKNLKAEAGGSEDLRIIAVSNRQDKFAARNAPKKNNDFLTPSEGVSAGMMDFLIGLGSTGQIVASTLQNSLGQAVGSLSTNIWEATKGTQKWSDAFRSLGDIAGRAITELIVKLLVVQTIESALGWLAIGSKGGTVTGGLSNAPNVKGAGGGTFLTRGPTHFTVGDNPGGVELVHVTPLSGIGQSTINGMAMRMAGGGSALVAGGASGGGISGGTFYIDNSNADAAGIARLEATIRALNGTIENRALAATFEAKRRRRGGFR